MRSQRNLMLPHNVTVPRKFSGVFLLTKWQSKCPTLKWLSPENAYFREKPPANTEGSGCHFGRFGLNHPFDVFPVPPGPVRFQGLLLGWHDGAPLVTSVLSQLFRRYYQLWSGQRRNDCGVSRREEWSALSS